MVIKMTKVNNNKSDENTKEKAIWHEKKDVRRQWHHMISIMKTYFDLPSNLSEFILDIQLYSPREYDNTQTEPRIWLTCPKNNMGINLMLYSVKLENKYGMVSNEDAIEVFSEYMKYYSLHQDEFTFTNDFEHEYTIKIKFEVSNR